MKIGANWYAVAIAEGLESGTCAGVRLFDKEIVLWRDGAGSVHAWEDRCPHRGMRLSFGFVRGDRIACLYHGWQYSTDGQCRYIPAHPDLTVPTTIRATAYPCCESIGMVWIYSELGAEPPPTPPPERQPVTPVRSIYLEHAAETIAERLAGGGVPPFPADAANSRPAVEQHGALLSVRHGETEFLAALQPVGESKSALHLAICGRGEEWRGNGQKRVAQWAQELRGNLQQRSFAIPR